MYSKQESFATFSEVLIVLYRWCDVQDSGYLHILKMTNSCYIIIVC